MTTAWTPPDTLDADNPGPSAAPAGGRCRLVDLYAYQPAAVYTAAFDAFAGRPAGRGGFRQAWSSRLYTASTPPSNRPPYHSPWVEVDAAALDAGDPAAITTPAGGCRLLDEPHSQPSAACQAPSNSGGACQKPRSAEYGPDMLGVGRKSRRPGAVVIK